MSALLPSNATDFEKSLSLSTDVLEKLGPSAGAVARFKSVPGDPVLPFLIWEYGLGEIQPYLVEPRRIIREGLIWQRLRGTPAALRMAFSWIGQDVFIEEDGAGEHWATYQLGLPQIATDGEVRRVLHLARLSHPARCRLWRIYTPDFDRRPIVLSEGPVLGDGWLSYYSGVPVDGGNGEDVLVSFGTKNGFQSEAYLRDSLCASFGNTLQLGLLAPYLDRFVVGRSALSQPYPNNHGFAMSSVFSILWADRATVGRTWRGMWDARSWREYTGFDRKLPKWRMGRRSFSRSQLVPGWGEPLSETNARLGASFATLIDNPARLSGFKLSEHDSGRREPRIHEFVIAASGMEVPPLRPGIPRMGGAARLLFSFQERLAKRGPFCLHSTLASGMEQKAPGPAHSALTQILPAQSASLAPPVNIPAAVRSFAAPVWSGPWDAPGRTWDSAAQTDVQ